MKQFSLLAILMAMAIGVGAQVNMYVWQNGVKTTYPTNEVDSITFGEDEGEADGDVPSEEYISIIRVDDGSVADWEDVPEAYLFSASTASSAKWTALKEVKVYADEQYINVLVSYDTQQITNTEWVPFHIYINTDNSATTGGYGDQWTDADTDVMLEAAILSGGAHVSYEPLAFEWIGDVGGNGWAWGSLEQGEQAIGKSQIVNGLVEIQLSRELLPGEWDEDGFSIGFDIQQNWSSVGVLPNTAVSSGNSSGKANKLRVAINRGDGTSDEEAGVETKTVNYVATDALFPNPERGFLKQIYYTSEALSTVNSANTVRKNREEENITLYLDNYFMMDYMESDISASFLNRMENNFKALREGGGKAVLRYSYKYDDAESAQPWDAESEWILRHIEQLAPYWEEYADVILCLEAGFIGVWGEWYYTTNFPFNPTNDADFAPRWVVLNALLEALPADRQIALRTPAFKMRYLQMHDEDVSPLTAEEAYQNNAKARLCGHNDCFVASSSDYGTYTSDEDRAYWAEDTKYTLMGGETCGECELSTGTNAIKEMEKYHWTYINDGYHPDVLESWESDGSMTEIARRLGYRFVLEKGVFTVESNRCTVELRLRNDGFAALANPRDVELVFVNKTDSTDVYVYKQDIDPRFWMAGEQVVVELHAELDAKMAGEYEVYLNLPDAYEGLRNNPAFSIRLANENMWDEARGYNYLTNISL